MIYIVRQRGGMLVAFAVILGIAALFGVVQALESASRGAPAARRAAERETLVAARLALVAFAADNRNRPGGLPCPDRDGDGEAELACDRPADRIGALPWQTLRLGDRRDASGERLWYAVAAGYRNDADLVINAATPGDLAVPAAGWRDLAAVVFAPGVALGQQRREGTRDPVHYLEHALDATGALRAGAAANDVLEPLAADELWATLDNVVAARISREIVPLIEREYVDRWGSLPAPAPFAAPDERRPVASSDAAIGEGMLPATREPAWVSWDRGSVALTQAGGSGRLISSRCERSLLTELRCDVDYAGDVLVELTARAVHIGHALVAPTGASGPEFAPASLAGRSVAWSPLAADGSSRVTARARLPVAGTTVRIALGAPAHIRALTDRSLPVAQAGAWFARNEWFRFAYFAVARDYAPGGARRGCGLPSACLTLAGHPQTVRAPAILVYTGRGRAGAGAAEARFLEGDNATTGDGVFAARPALAGANDAGIPVCATPGRCRWAP